MRRNLILIALVAVIAMVVLGSRRLRGGGQSDTTKSPTAAPGNAALEPRAAASKAGWEGDRDSVGDQLLEGQVLDHRDQPVGGATVSIDTQPPRIVVTEADGSFVMDGLLRRRYQVTASATAGVAGPVTVRLDADTDPVVLRLEAPGSVTVVVVDAATRAPIAGADVEVRAPLVVTASTGPDGNATLTPVVRGHWNVIARAPGHARAHGAVIVGAEPIAITLALDRGVAVHGRVLDSQGGPIAGARVWAVSSSDWTDGVSPERDGVSAGSDGRFVLDGVGAGAYRLRGRAHGYAPGSSADLIVGDAAVEPVTITLPDAATLRGRVEYGDGKPAAGAAVRVYLPGGHQPVTHAGDDGRFVIADLPRNTVSVAAEGQGASCWSQAVSLEGGDAEVTLRLDLTDAVAGVVVDSSGTPIEAAQVEVSLVRDGSRFVRGELTDGAGSFRIAGLPQGEYEVVATRPGIAPAPSDQRIRAHTGTSVRIVLAAPGSIVGKVAFADGTAPAVVTVQLTAHGERRVFTDGEVEIRDLAPGTYQLRIEGPDLVATEATRTLVVEDRETDLGTIRVERGRSVEGIAVDSEGRPVTGAEVLAGAVLVGTGATADSGTRAPTFQGELKRATTGSDGRFTLRGLGARPLSIVATHAVSGRSSPQRIDPSASGALRLTLLATGSISGSVTLGGRPVAAAVSAQPREAPLAMSIVVAGADGTFHFDRIAPGRYSVASVAGDPLSGAPMAPVGVDVVSGKASPLELAAVLGSRTLEVSSVGTGVVFVTTADVEVGHALDLVTRLGIQEGGHWAMRPLKEGFARFTSLESVAYTCCVVAVDEPIAEMGTMLELLSRRGAGMPTSCRRVAADAAVVSVRP